MNSKYSALNIPHLKIDYWIIFFFFLIAGTFIKLFFLFQESLWPDEALYLYIARNLSSDLTNLTDISGRAFYHNPPLLMYLLSLLPTTSAVNLVFASRAVIILMGIGTIVTTFFIGKKVYHPVVGLIAAGFLAVCPLSNWTSLRILTDTPVVFFIYLSICLLLYDQKLAFYFFGICAVLTKYSAFPILFIPFLMRLKIKTCFLIYILMFLMLLNFIIIRSSLPTPSGWINSFYYYFQIPDMFHMFKETEFFLGYFLMVFAAIGFIFTLKERKYSALFHWILFFGLFRFFLPWVIFRASRYSLPLYPGLFIFAAYGCHQSILLISSKWPKYSKLAILFIVLAIPIVLIFHGVKSIDIMKQTSSTFTGFDKAGTFLKNQPAPHTVATASPRQMKFYNPDFNVYDIGANMTPDSLKLLIEAKNIQYLSIDLWSPHLPAWFKTFDFKNNGYHLIYVYQRVYLFRILKNNHI